VRPTRPRDPWFGVRPAVNWAEGKANELVAPTQKVSELRDYAKKQKQSTSGFGSPGKRRKHR